VDAVSAFGDVEYPWYVHFRVISFFHHYWDLIEEVADRANYRLVDLWQKTQISKMQLG
jgi:hypothetical protein